MTRRPQSGTETVLPTPLTSLVGREREVALAGDLLRQSHVRLLTLTGAGGVGKTRLALEVARRAAPEWGGAVVFVTVAAIRDPSLVLPEIARTFGLADAGDQPLTERLIAFLHDGRWLLLLDNLEQVVAVAPALADLLVACPGLSILATSRIRLRVSGEQEFAVPPLALTPSEYGTATERGEPSEALRLFVARAQSAAPGFVLTEANTGTITAICRRLDGLPLAIELAAARIKLLPPAALLARLEPRLPLLTGGPRDQPARLQTMRDAIAWSYDLLSTEEQWLFRRLSVFVGGFTLEAVEVTMEGEGGKEDSEGEGGKGGKGDSEGERGKGGKGEWNEKPTAGHDHASSASVLVGPSPFPPFPPSPSITPSSLDRVTALLDSSLLHHESGADGEPRYGMLETVREYALDQLAAAGEDHEARSAHARWCLSFAEGLDSWGLEQASAFARLTDEHDNVRAALEFLLAQGDAERAQRMTGRLWELWFMSGRSREGRQWAERALALGEASAAARAGALTGAGALAYQEGDLAHAAARVGAGAALHRQLGDHLMVGVTMGLQGNIALAASDLSRAQEFFEAEREAYRLAGHDVAIAVATLNLARIAAARGELAAAEALFVDAYQALAGTGPWESAIAAYWLGRVAGERGDRPRAFAFYREALTTFHAYADAGMTALCFAGLASLVAPDEPHVAARLLGADAALRERAGRPTNVEDRRLYEQTMTLLRTLLSEAELAAALGEGRATPLDAVVAAALAVAAREPSAPAQVPTATFGLSAREREILALLAAGHSDREIATALSISHRTVMRHVSGILTKLDVANRTAATNLAIRHHLV